MSREHTPLTDNTEIHYGSDHVLGYYMDLTDRRYAASPHDLQGEGYVLEWNRAFGFTLNLIGATVEDLGNEEKLIELTEKFISNL